ncbi:hypothetical protein [Streptomyces sp. NRRL F-5123]|uniref:hypothetical protein n=1 Tax=Streptomyces sp. NRRL F-5123 TaxID=1463856 RepID=UPI0004E202FD|nr:hypothetical protein [Streptomyces sp. NRRL F-5123]
MRASARLGPGPGNSIINNSSRDARGYAGDDFLWSHVYGAMAVARHGLGRTAEEVLAETARITDPALVSVVNDLPSPSLIAGEHVQDTLLDSSVLVPRGSTTLVRR